MIGKVYSLSLFYNIIHSFDLLESQEGNTVLIKNMIQFQSKLRGIYLMNPPPHFIETYNTV